MDTVQILLITLEVLVLLAISYVVTSSAAANKAGERRLNSVRQKHSLSASGRMDAQMKKAIAARRTSVYGLDATNSRIEALALRLEQTGKGWTVAQYLQASAGLTLLVTLLVLLKSGALPLALGLGLVVGAGVPHMVVGFVIKRRIANFNARFPDAIELLVRGLRSGLPIAETLGVVAAEIPGACGIEFRQIVERIRIGKTMDEALQDTANRLNIPEFNFFCITIAIQRETGGNLAETLANLADVLRKRMQMKLKIKAMSSEAKASAYIVGALPFIVFTLIYMTNPDYVGGFFHEERLIVAGLGGLTWMSIGVFIMAKMVNFEI